MPRKTIKPLDTIHLNGMTQSQIDGMLAFLPRLKSAFDQSNGWRWKVVNHIDEFDDCDDDWYDEDDATDRDDERDSDPLTCIEFGDKSGRVRINIARCFTVKDNSLQWADFLKTLLPALTTGFASLPLQSAEGSSCFGVDTSSWLEMFAALSILPSSEIAKRQPTQFVLPRPWTNIATVTGATTQEHNNKLAKSFTKACPKGISLSYTEEVADNGKPISILTIVPISDTTTGNAKWQNEASRTAALRRAVEAGIVSCTFKFNWFEDYAINLEGRTGRMGNTPHERFNEIQQIEQTIAVMAA